MGLGAEVDRESDAVREVTAVARRTPCPVFLDLLWPPAPAALHARGDPGVLFETASRVVVFQRIGGELRYYAGGWCPDPARVPPGQKQAEAEGGESGVFGSVPDALAFAEQYLDGGRNLAGGTVSRVVVYSHDGRTTQE